MSKIVVQNPIVNLEGDEMAQVMWQWIRKKIIEPFLDLPLITFDLSLPHRERTQDKVTIEAAQAIQRYKVGVKCATITPDEARQREFGLSRLWPSPNGTIRNWLGGTLFREPIVVQRIPRWIPSWKAPIVVARHAFGDQYKATEVRLNQPGRVSLIFEPQNGGSFEKWQVAQLESPGVVLGMFNIIDSIQGFARSVFNYALLKGYPVYLGTKNTILKIYDGAFKRVFEEIYESEFRNAFEARGLFFEHRLVDDLLASAIRLSGPFIWACKNYEGDLFSDLVAQGFGSLGLMTSVLLTPDGEIFMSEAAHGTVTRHYRLWQQGQKTSTNPVASIFAWIGALRFRAQKDQNRALEHFVQTLEKTCYSLLEEGHWTGDLARLTQNQNCQVYDTEAYIDLVAHRLKQAL